MILNDSPFLELKDHLYYCKRFFLTSKTNNSFNKHVLSAYHVVNAFLSVRDTAENKPLGIYVLSEEKHMRQIYTVNDLVS